jgi:hypothetical protein
VGVKDFMVSLQCEYQEAVEGKGRLGGMVDTYGGELPNEVEEEVRVGRERYRIFGGRIKFWRSGVEGAEREQSSEGSSDEDDDVDLPLQPSRTTPATSPSQGAVHSSVSFISSRGNVLTSEECRACAALQRELDAAKMELRQRAESQSGDANNPAPTIDFFDENTLQQLLVDCIVEQTDDLCTHFLFPDCTLHAAHIAADPVLQTIFKQHNDSWESRKEKNWKLYTGSRVVKAIMECCEKYFLLGLSEVMGTDVIDQALLHIMASLKDSVNSSKKQYWRAEV